MLKKFCFFLQRSGSFILILLLFGLFEDKVENGIVLPREEEKTMPSAVRGWVTLFQKPFSLFVILKN